MYVTTDQFCKLWEYYLIFILSRIPYWRYTSAEISAEILALFAKLRRK